MGVSLITLDPVGTATLTVAWVREAGWGDRRALAAARRLSSRGSAFPREPRGQDQAAVESGLGNRCSSPAPAPPGGRAASLSPGLLSAGQTVLGPTTLVMAGRRP